MANPFDAFDTKPETFPVVTVGRRDPVKTAQEERAAALSASREGRAVEDQALQREAAERAAEASARAAAAAERGNTNSAHSNVMKLAGDYNSDPTVKAYRTAIAQFAQALNTGEGAQADLALTYAFAKAMDPESVVRESEQGMVTASQPWFQAMVEKTKKTFGMDGAGNFSPEARDRLREQIANAVAQRQRVYDARRQYFEKQAQTFGVDPEVIIGAHDKEPFLNDIDTFNQRLAQREAERANPEGQATAAPTAPLSPTVTDDSPSGDYRDSYVGQGLSGVNEGIAGVVGAPVDLTTAALNLGSKGVNALTNADIPAIQNPLLGSQWWKDLMSQYGSINAPTDDPTKQFVRRVGESVGAAAIPVAGMGGSAARMGGGMLTGLGGGIGGATAQQVAPGNVYAEILGELAGGGLTGLGVLKSAQRGAQRQIEAAIPTVEDLKKQAGNLYQQAEQRGVTASPTQTQQLVDDMRQTLVKEGQIGPLGKVTDVDAATAKAYGLVEQYAGMPMRPVEMDTVRRILGNSRKSPNAEDQRMGSILLEQFDDFVRPLAPEFDEARQVSSRYLQAEDLEQARELARLRAPQFSASGFENALRTEYRGLDRGSVRGKDWFDPQVTEAIQKVSRGTTGSNVARNLGRFAPTGPVSLGLGTGGPAAIGAAVGGPVGAAVGGTAALGLGLGGRAVATQMGLRNAELAELIARNGAPIEQAPLIPGAFKDYTATLAAIQQAKYLSERPKP